MAISDIAEKHVTGRRAVIGEALGKKYSVV